MDAEAGTLSTRQEGSPSGKQVHFWATLNDVVVFFFFLQKHKDTRGSGTDSYTYQKKTKIQTQVINWVDF